MQNNYTLTNNGIKFILNESKINIEENLDMYFQLIDYKSLSEQHNLYLCKMKDNNDIYERFILKSSRILEKNNIIHIIKIKITISGKKKNINCLRYENLSINEYINRINQKILEEKRIREEKEKEEEELKKKKLEEEKNEALNEDLNKDTKFILMNLKQEEKKQRYNFKWDKGNLKYIDLSGKLSNLFINKNNKNDDSNFDIFSDSNGDNEIINNKNEEITPEVNEINEINQNIIENVEKSVDEDKKEIEEIFEGINLKDISIVNKKVKNQSKKLEQEFELIVNLSTRNYRKPIYVKCTKKIILINKKKGKDWKYLYLIFRDSDGGEINANVFGEYHIKTIDSKITLNGVYIISQYRITPITSSIQLGGNFRLILNAFTKVEPMPPDPVFNQIHFHFLTIDDLFFFKEGCTVDICGIIYDEGESRYYNMKIGQKFMRNVLIGDMSMKKVIITFWEPHSKDNRIKLEKGEIIAMKYVKIGISATNVKKLNTINYTLIQNSTGDYKKDLELKDFYEKNPDIDNFLFIYKQENYRYLKDIQSQIEHNTIHKIDKYQFCFITKAYVENFSIDEESIYKGCPLCSKKLIELERNKYECLLCNKIFNKPKYIYKLTLKVRDANAHAYFKLMGYKGNKVLEVDPEIVRKYLDEGNNDQLEKLEKKVLFNEYIFNITLKSFMNDKGRIFHSMNIDNMVKADGENLKRILQLVGDDDEN